MHLGPTFDASVLCAAGADLIAGDLLLDIKTRAGHPNPGTGVRSDALPLDDIYQLLGYALFDRSDRYGIRRIGIYSARYGKLTTWDLIRALDLLAGEPVVLAEERETVWGLLGGQGGKAPPGRLSGSQPRSRTSTDR